MILKNPDPENPRSAQFPSRGIPPGYVRIYEVSPVIFLHSPLIGEVMVEDKNRYSRLLGNLLGLPALGAAIHHHQKITSGASYAAHHILVKSVTLTVPIRNEIPHRRPSSKTEFHSQGSGSNAVHIVISVDNHPRVFPQTPKKIFSRRNSLSKKKGVSHVHEARAQKIPGLGIILDSPHTHKRSHHTTAAQRLRYGEGRIIGVPYMQILKSHCGKHCSGIHSFEKIVHPLERRIPQDAKLSNPRRGRIPFYQERVILPHSGHLKRRCFLGGYLPLKHHRSAGLRVTI
jgi:hypothetical protein